MERGLSYSKSIEKLDISENNIEDQGCVAIRKILKENDHLKELNISSTNGITT